MWHSSIRKTAMLPFPLGACVVLTCIAACGGEAALAPGRPSALHGPLLLVAPANGERFRQNDASLGCSDHETRGYGFRVAFDWRDVSGAAAYKIVFWHTGSQFPAVERVVVESEYAETFCNAFVADFNLDHWVWRVAAVGPANSEAQRDTLWSEQREYGFEPCRLRDTQPCFAPAQ